MAPGTSIVVGLGLIALVVVLGQLWQQRQNWIASAPQVDETGPLVCPYCEHKVAGLVHYLGQGVTCPQCHAAFHAPDHRGVTASESFQQAQWSVIRGVLGLIGGLLIIWWVYRQ